MDQLKDDSIAGTSDQNPKIKEEVNNEYEFSAKNPTSCKDASEEKRTFLVTLSGDGRKHQVRGKLTDSLLSALKSSTYVFHWMNKRKGEEFSLIEKKEPWNVCFNMGMPLKYVSDCSQFELKSYKATNEAWYRKYDVEKECMVFYVHKSVSSMKCLRAQRRRLIKNLQLFKESCILCICAPKGESIKDAVCNDGRFMTCLEEENWTLDKGATVMDNNFPVDNLSDHVYGIGVESKKESARCSRDLRRKKQNDSDLGGKQLSTLEKPQPRPDLEEGQLSASKKQQPEPDCEQEELGTSKRQQPESDCEQGRPSTSKRQQPELFELQILPWYPKLKEETENIAKLLRRKKAKLEACKRDFGKEINDSLSCKLVRALTSYMDSVGYIGMKTADFFRGIGTCFVLKDRYILTCHHVIRNIVGEGIEAKDWGNRIKESALVTFSYEEEHRGETWFSLESWFEIGDVDLDFAVLKLAENGSKSHPPLGLLKFNSSPPSNGPIFIIGHPNGGVKSMDVCLVVGLSERGKAIEDHWQKRQKFEHCICVSGYRPEKCIHKHNPEDIKIKTSKPNIVTYDTCFFEGSSGSPVFNKYGQLIALHTGGFRYEMGNKHCSVIEYGYSIDSIILKIKSTFKSWHDDIIAPGAKEDTSHVDAFVSEAWEEMDCS